MSLKYEMQVKVACDGTHSNSYFGVAGLINCNDQIVFLGPGFVLAFAATCGTHRGNKKRRFDPE